MKESMAQERTRTARTARLPELQIGLKGGFVGQPVVWERGLSAPLYPDAPDWSQNYAIDLAQPLYQGGKIRSAIHKADIEKQVAELQTLTDRAEIKLKLLNQYMNLFSLFKQHEILMRNIEESELRLHDIRRMKKEGLITNNDVLRSEMQLTNDRLSLQETENSIVLVSQQLDILLGQDESVLLRPDTALLYRAVALQSYDDYIVQAYANNPVMKLLRAQTELARNEIRSTKSFSLPGISLYASNTLARPVSRTLADMYNNNWNIGLSLSYPLSSLYKNNHKIKESKWMVSLHKNEEEQKKQKIRMFPCELPAYKTVRPSSGFRIGTVFISAPRPGRTAPDGELSAIRPRGGSGFRKFPAKKRAARRRPSSIIFRRTSGSPLPTAVWVRTTWSSAA